MSDLKAPAKITKPKTLIFIGFRSKTDSIKTANQEGFKVILLTKKAPPEALKLFDKIIEGDLLDSQFIQGIIPTIKAKYSIKGIISNYEHYVVVRSYLAERFGIPSSTVYSAACTRNKAMQRHALKYMKENVEHRVVKTKQQALDAFKTLGGDVFIKSIAGVKSAHVFHVETEEEIIKSFNILAKEAKTIDKDLYNDYKYCDFNFEYPDPNNTFLVEKAIRGRQVTVATLTSSYTIWNAPSLCDIYPASHLGIKDSFLAFRILPSNLPKDVIRKVKNTADGLVKVLGMRYSPVHTELMIDENNEVKIIETASRMGGYRDVMYREAYGIKLNQLLVKSVIGKEIKTRRKPLSHVSMMEIFPTDEGIFDGIENIELIDQDPHVINIDIMAHSGDKVGPAKLSFRPCLRFIIKGKNYKEVYNKSVDYQKRIKIIIKKD